MALLSGVSMNGPFFCERMLFRLPLHDELVASFVVACLIAKRRFTPRRHRVVALNSAFTAAVRMIDRIHHNAANRRPNSQVPSASCLSDRDVLMIQVSYLTDRCYAVHIHQPHLAGGEFHV